ncbi:glycosyltransferase [Candidatus Planktophila dulcis]|jgi:glycosyltransferase involved in cell wall biosynthesis|uniref:glycosyltransferase family 2 protein n=1 Tax=Candidatus Planktophila dulcis TaxID=1884914 RepID=UPI000BAC5FE1|nr:glycosyltransferase family 2 protein [Candidatus Planktophila dulcis]ASY21583.1 glycosyltransferase [Candidatus Planktophila dulcis]
MATQTPELFGSPHPSISVILPVLNEEAHLEDAVHSILSQDYQGKIEVILAVGPSHDRTLEIAQSISRRDSRVVLVDNPSGRTAAGLNLALNKSQSPVVVRVDGHAQIPNDYLRLIVEILNKTGAVNVGGVMAAVGTTPFERAVAGAMRSPLGVGASRFHTGGEAGVVDTVYLGAFRREALVAIGGFDERFTRAQDWELNFRLREKGGIVYFDPRLHVTYRPRSTVRALAKQYFEYGRWRRVVSRRHSGTINYRYLAPPFALVGFSLSVIAGFFLPILFIPAWIYLLFVLAASVRIASSIREYFLLLAVIPTMHFAWGAGFISSPKTLVPSSE